MTNKLNQKYIKILKQMRKLNTSRASIFSEFKTKIPNAKIRNMTTVSLYHDLYGNDIDI